MPGPIKTYIRYVDAINRVVGTVTMYMVFMMMGILLFAAFSRSILNLPLLWAVEMAQFTMAAYYLLGGGYSMQLDGHVRMDVLYDTWTPRRRAFADSITAFCLVFYLGFLLFGGFSSTLYSLEYGQTNYSVWAPPMAPIKIFMTLGVLLMLLQAFAIFFRDLAKAMGKEIS